MSQKLQRIIMTTSMGEFHAFLSSLHQFLFDNTATNTLEITGCHF